MIDMNKQYTYNGKPVRIYADDNDTTGGIYCAVMNDDLLWKARTIYECDLVEVWQPTEGDIVYMWDNVSEIISIFIRRFSYICSDKLYRDEQGIGFNYCAPFTGNLPEAFKGL